MKFLSYLAWFKGICPFWRSGWVVNFHAIEHIHIKWSWRFSWGELWDFWWLINLDLLFVSKSVCLTESKQVQKSTHHPSSCVLNSSQALGLWHHKGTWMECWKRVSKSGVLGTEQVGSIFYSLCHLLSQVRWDRGDRHPTCNKMISVPGLSLLLIGVWSRTNHLSYRIISSILALA